ncbi:phytoene desaturase family protein [Leptospira sp. GIMC2001]|uniref:phytoene desaturase family protein n=1 Tax=Leptospira sp. GIMC2001 TaxID=1513297 RepID=UPI00234A9780|nr:NAD(P)/FAD-dependent oxidoreductase [Leptospira sp. GIMC2001]WCL48461.1 NAD(P)/FAD-dependent oxidoreductase [Leptospira sp. GIMC2001]
MSKENLSENYDIIFIGSGIGSLTSASLLAQFEDKKILIIEKHFQAGGYTHSFARKQNKYHWDVGIHYVGDMHDSGFCRLLMDKITRNNVQWQKMSEPFEKFVYPNRTFELYGNEEKFKSDLIAQFPEEEESIIRYFSDVHKASALFGKSMMMKSSTPDLSAFTKQMQDPSIITLKDYLDYHFKNDDIKAILASQWGDYGLPPSKCLFATHAALVVHYFNGGYYPVGGGGKIFDSIEPILAEKGGAVVTTTEVLEIIIEDSKAIGVKTRFLRGQKQERNFYAPVIVSCAGAYPTYTKLIPDSVEISFRDPLKDFYKKEKMATSICIYLGLSESPAKFGFKGENYWIFASNDHEENFQKRNDWLKDFSEIKNMYVSFPSLKDPDAKNHTADIISFTDYSLFEKWKDQPWKKRGEEYEEMKKKIAETVISSIDTRYPGFKDIIDYIEVSTPLTNEHFTSHPDGAIYGLACVPERYDKEKSPWFDCVTPIAGLYLTGADAGGSPGIAGAMMGGLAVTQKIHGSRALLKWLMK